MKNNGKRRALVVGATGLVGGHLLSQLAECDAYEAIATLGRRAPDVAHDRVTHQVANLADDAAGLTLPETDVLFCCLGTTIKKAGSKAAFRAIDFELVVRIGRAAIENGASTCAVVSSVGADVESKNFYLRTKGEMEQAVAALGFERLGILRPSLLLGVRDESRPAERLGQWAATVVNPLLAGGLARYRAVDAANLAAAMIDFDLSAPGGKQIIEGRNLLKPRVVTKNA